MGGKPLCAGETSSEPQLVVPAGRGSARRCLALGGCGEGPRSGAKPRESERVRPLTAA